MREVEYSEAAVEVLDILNHTSIEDVSKIPQSFMNFLIDISNKTYKSKLNHEQPIKGLNLRKQTRELLGFIYITWWCNREEREKYKNQIQNEKIKKEEVFEQYGLNDIFKNRIENKEKSSIQNEHVEQISIVTYKKEKAIKKLLGKILKFFKFKGEGR